MRMPGMGELLIILVIVVLVFGANKLPQLGDGIGKAIKNFKRGIDRDDEVDVTPTDHRVTPTDHRVTADSRVPTGVETRVAQTEVGT